MSARHRNWLWAIFGLPLLIFSLACDRRDPTPRTRDHDLQRAYHLIDQDQHDEAIALLIHLRTLFPLDPEIKLALASAYVNQSGFDIYNFYHIVDLFTADQLGEGRRNEVTQTITEGTLRYSLKERLRPYLEPLVAILQFIELFDAIPLLSPQSAELFEKALKVLHEESDPVSRGALLYRILLQIMETKYYVTEGLLQSDSASLSERNCSLKIGELSMLISDLKGRLELVASDLGQLFPDQDSTLKSYLKFLDDLIPYLGPNSTEIELTEEDVHGLFPGIGSMRCL